MPVSDSTRLPTATRLSHRARRTAFVAVAAAPVAAAALVLLAGPALAGPARAQATPLGTAGAFEVLAGSGITNTGPTTVHGDVGTFPTPDETGFASVTFAAGTNHDADAVTQNAKGDLTTAYDSAAGRSGTSTPTELGGTTLDAGVYTSPTLGLTGTLTLDGQGDPNAEFVLQAGSTLITASDSHVLLIGGATWCNVTWQVGSSATFGTGSQFAGTVLAHTSITATTGATFSGRLLAETGAVTLDSNTLDEPTCSAVTTPPTSTPPTTATTQPTTATTPVATPSTPTSGAGTSPSVTTTGEGSQPSTTSTAGGLAATPARPAPTSAATDSATDRDAALLAGSTGTAATSSSGDATGTLPFTGASVTGTAIAGLALLTGGGIALTAGRRRRH